VNWTCNIASYCAGEWWPIGIGDVNGDGHPDLMWYDQTTGVVETWLLNGSGDVIGTQNLNWTCSVASGCADQWQPIGLADVNGDGHPDVVWWNRSTGVVEAWLLNGSGHVLSAQYLNWTCNVASGCVDQWRPIALGDVNGDGHTDLMWWDEDTGVLESWLLNGSGDVLGTQNLNWTCGLFDAKPSGCAAQWQPIGLGDVNGDGHPDLVWYDQTTGVVESWLLNGSGDVLGTQNLNWTCSVASGCADQWQPIGLAAGGL
jgi:FG-GAP-like repeat